MERNTLFIIPSAIHITEKPLCYTAIRSVFTAEERCSQTLKTIQSVRTALPDSKILLIEMGLEKDLPYNITELVDKYLYLGNKKMVRDAVDSPFKGLGEALCLYLANRSILSFNADYYFKLSGRYYLTDAFKLTDWTDDGYTGKKNDAFFYTVLYGFPKRLYSNWRHSLKQSMPALSRGEAIEYELAKYFDQPVLYREKIGACGLLAFSGGLLSI